MTLRKLFCCTIFIACSFKSSLSQNTGIGTTTPTEKLDVNGNINLSGTIKANGVAGQAGQVLVTNNSGNLEWSNICNYQKFITYSYTSSGAIQYFTVPAGVTKVLVELWGGGGAGYLGTTSSTFGAGGGGGGYAKGWFAVTPGNFIAIVVGSAGNSGNPAGGLSTVDYGGFVYGSSGGQGGSNSNGQGGTFYTTNPTMAIIGLAGQGGFANVIEYFQISSTNFAKVWKLGNGGNGGNTIHTGGNGGSYTFDVTGAAVINNVAGSVGWVPGGGGPASINNPNVVVGGDGRVIIYY
jgi:hypothetical protein